MTELISADQFAALVRSRSFVIDVRAPVEFSAGSIPGSVNLPILNNEERHEIGNLYKEQGSAAAVARGYELISGPVKEARLQRWVQFVQKNPKAILTCFRGGKRSQISQSWLAEAGIRRPRIDGGYKAFRHFLIQEMERLSVGDFCVISGATGSGKTLVVREAQTFRPTVDLESYARHRGSAFGGYPGGQPSQADFENLLATELICLEDSVRLGAKLVVEDESRLIGKCIQPESFFNSLRASGIVLLDEPLDSRVQVTFDDYILNSPIASGLESEMRTTFERYRNSLQIISRKLGGLRYSQTQKAFDEACAASFNNDFEPHKKWIEMVLEAYYDPLYFKSLERRQPRILFRGRRVEALQWLRENSGI
jgi:tRNA 2-selenouridine synthase